MFGRDKKPPAPVRRPLPDSGARIARGVESTSRWTLRLIVLAVGLALLGWLIGQFWTVVLPILLALLLSSILWPPVKWLRRWMPPAAAAALGVLMVPAFIGLLGWLTTVMVAGQWRDLADQFRAGVEQLMDWLAGPPFNLDTGELDDMIDQGLTYLQDNAGSLSQMVLAGLGTAGSIAVTLVLALILSFLMIKDGPRFLPWVRTWTGDRVAEHVTGLTGRVWDTLGIYMWNQAAVAAIDAVFIGLGAWLLGVPFPIPIAILTFFGGFVPIVGAFAAGAVAVLVALVAQGPWIALAMLGVVVLVQQLEGNLVQPILMGNSLKLHASVVIVSVTAGGALFGIIGALLAVPAAAVVMVSAQYVREQVLVRPDRSPTPVEIDD